jgi:hypothetical protein
LLHLVRAQAGALLSALSHRSMALGAVHLEELAASRNRVRIGFQGIVASGSFRRSLSQLYINRRVFAGWGVALCQNRTAGQEKEDGEEVRT